MPILLEVLRWDLLSGVFARNYNVANTYRLGRSEPVAADATSRRKLHGSLHEINGRVIAQ